MNTDRARALLADNCSGLTDCSFGVKVALVAAAIALVLLAVVLLPELIAAAAAEEAAAAAAAEVAAAEAAEAAAAAAAEAASAEAAAAEAVAAEEAAAGFTESDLSQVAEHLERPGMDPSPANDAMIQRIEQALQDGRALTEGETNFMTHEMTEKALMDQGMSYEEAHAAAMETHPPMKNYDPEVIQQFPEYFNNNWLRAWGLIP